MTSLMETSAEIIELIVSRSNFSSICNLRLVSRDVSAKATHGVVKSDFQDKTVIWTDVNEIKSLAERTSKGWRGCLIDCLIIVGVMEEEADVLRMPTTTGLFHATHLYSDVKAAVSYHKDQADFIQMLAGLRRNAPHGHLNNLCLRVRRRTNNGRLEDSDHIRDWNSTLEIAAHTFSTTMSALIKSGMPVLRLDIFGSGSPRCALMCNRITDILLDQTVQTGLNLSMLTHLSIGLCGARTMDQSHRELLLEDHPPNALLSLLVCCPSLTCLAIRWYNIGRSGADYRGTSKSEVFTQLVNTSLGRVVLQRLRRWRIRGIHITEPDLLAYVKHASNLESFSLE